MKIFRIFFLLAIFQLSGCSSLYLTFAEETKSSQPSSSRIYRGTKFDGEMLLMAPLCTGGLHGCGEGKAQWFIIGPAALIDLPLSFVSDTLLLPYTISHDKKQEKDRADIASSRNVTKPLNTPTPLELDCSAKIPSLSAQEYCACIEQSFDPASGACITQRKSSTSLK